MFDSSLANLSFHGAEFLTTGREPVMFERQTAGPSGLFETADGEITITCGKDKMFRAFCLDVAERPDWLEDPRFASIPVRMRNGAVFLEQLIPLFKSKPGGFWSERCKRAGIPCGEVRSAGEALLSPEASERGLVFAIPHPTAGAAPVIAQPIQLSETPCRYGAPPLLGQHTGEVLEELLGYSRERITELESTGAIALGKVSTGAAA
jgi:formyl-CoA transferase